MPFMNNGFNNIQNEWFNSFANVNSSKDVKKFTNPFKYKCEALNCYVCFNIFSKCNMQHVNNVFNKLKVDDLTHVKMLTIKKCKKTNSLNHSNINAKY
jgi:hypothetical protein